MNAPAIGVRLARRGCIVSAAWLICGFATAGLRAQTAITTVNTQLFTGTATTVTTDGQSVTFDNNDLAVVGFIAGGTTYYSYSDAQQALVQRDTTNNTYAPNQMSTWYAYTGNNTSPTYEGQYETTADSALVGNNIYQGTDNVLDNVGSIQQSSDDIERLDFLESTTGEKATTAQAFAVFDRGNDTNHDTFKIAVITGIDSNGNPTSYAGNLLTVVPNDYDTNANPLANQNYTDFRYDSGNDLTNTDSIVTGASIDSTYDQATQGIGGVAITLAQLGISAGTTIYGYSIMAADTYTTGTATVAINAAISADLVNYMNTTYYPTDSSDGTGGDGNYGGIDLMDINGINFESTPHPVPEPPFYGALMAAMGLGLFILRRRRWRLGV